MDGGGQDRGGELVRIADGERLLRLKEVEVKVGIGRSSIYKYMAEGRFPRPLELGPGTVRWKQSDIEGWISSLPISRGQ